MAPHDYCRNKAAPDGSSLHYSLLFLDAPRLHAITAVHAFRQEIADIIRSGMDTEPAHAKIAWWRMEVGALFEQHSDYAPAHPVTRQLAESQKQFLIAQEPLLEVIDGYDMDIHQGRYEDFNELQLYCHRVSGTISMICSEILGYQNQQTAKFSHELGIALQLIDLVRNVGLDARQGRIYLPLDELKQFGVSENDILDARADQQPTENLKALLKFQTQRIHELYKKALSLLAPEDRRTQRAALALAVIQHTMLKEVEREDYQVLHQGLSLTPLRSLWIASRTWMHG